MKMPGSHHLLWLLRENSASELIFICLKKQSDFTVRWNFRLKFWWESTLQSMHWPSNTEKICNKYKTQFIRFPVMKMKMLGSHHLLWLLRENSASKVIYMCFENRLILQSVEISDLNFGGNQHYKACIGLRLRRKFIISIKLNSSYFQLCKWRCQVHTIYFSFWGKILPQNWFTCVAKTVWFDSPLKFQT